VDLGEEADREQHQRLRISSGPS